MHFEERNGETAGERSLQSPARGCCSARNTMLVSCDRRGREPTRGCDKEVALELTATAGSEYRRGASGVGMVLGQKNRGPADLPRQVQFVARAGSLPRQRAFRTSGALDGSCRISVELRLPLESMCGSKGGAYGCMSGLRRAPAAAIRLYLLPGSEPSAQTNEVL